MKILIVTYGFSNRWSGGIHSYFHSIAPHLEKRGDELYFYDGNVVQIEQPHGLNLLPFALKGIHSNKFARYYEKTKPDAVHIQAEFGIGIGARNYCVSNQIPFSSSYHTHWDYFIPAPLIWSYFRWFYKPAAKLFTHTAVLQGFLEKKGIKTPMEVFPPGVDQKKWFYQKGSSLLKGYARPYFVTMSRISREKNLETFINLDLPGTKFVVGEGPDKAFLAKKYQDKAIFLPYEHARSYLSESDVFVIPSRFDTFNLTMLEALSSGLPVAAYPVMGPLGVIEQGVSGYLSENLQEAALSALSLKKQDAIHLASQYSWEKTAEAFANHQLLIE